MRTLLFISLIFCLLSHLCPAQQDSELRGIELALRAELEQQQAQSERIQQRERQAQDELSLIEQQLNDLSIAIYHQDYDNFFFLSYYCHEVSQLSIQFFSKQSPFYLMGQRIQQEITRLTSLRSALQLSLTDDDNSAQKSEQIKRSLKLCENILVYYQQYQHQLKKQKARFTRIASQIRALDLYANGSIVAGDDTRHRDSIGPDQMILQLFDEESSMETSETQSTKHSGIMAERLVQQLFAPRGMSGSLDLPATEHSYLSLLTQLPEQIAEQYCTPAHRTAALSIRNTLLYILGVGIALTLLSHLCCRLLQRHLSRRISKNRVRALTRSAHVLLYALLVWLYSSGIDEHYLAEHVRHFATFLFITAILCITLSTRLATLRIDNGFGLLIPLILANAAIMLFPILMCGNSIVLTLSPLIYLAAMLAMGWFCLFRMRKLRVSIRVFGLLSVLFLAFAAYASYHGYAYVMLMLSLFWYLFLINIELLAGLDKCSLLLSRKISNSPRLRDYSSYITLWVRLFTKNLILPISFLLIMWLSLEWPASCLDLSHFLDSWMMKEYEFNTIIKSISAALVLHLITVGIITNCALRLIQHTLLLLYRDTHEGGQKLTLLTILSLIVWLGYIIYCLMLMKADYQSILVILGGMSVGIGLGLKDNIENFICGISLLLGRLRMGDTVECGEHRGRVASIGFRTTTIETRCGAIICFQNKELFNQNFRNLTRNHLYERCIIKVGVAYGTDVEHARSTIMSALAPLHQTISQDHPYYVVLNDFGSSSVDLSVYVWVPVQGRSKARSIVREAIYRSLNEQGIEIPFPQRDIHLIESKKAAEHAGASPTLPSQASTNHEQVGEHQ